MTIEVEVGGARRTVMLRRAGERWLVTLDGHLLEVDVARAGDRWALRIGSADGLPGAGSPVRSHDVAFEPDTGPALVVHVDGTAVAVALSGTRESGRRPRARAAVAATGPHAIAAPMPGRIVRLLVGIGDQVEARQPLVVVEAMKMENELRAPRAGRVREVRVSEGTTVERGAVLVVLE